MYNKIIGIWNSTLNIFLLFLIFSCEENTVNVDLDLYLKESVFYDKNTNLLDVKQKDEIIDFAINVMLYQLDKDNYFWNNAICDYLHKRFGEKIESVRPDARDYISNVVKWIPREKNKFGWLYEKIVINWNIIHRPFLFENIDKSNDKYNKILNFCKMNFISF